VGLYEYLTWCEDIGAEPIMDHGCLGCIMTGYSLDGQSVAQGDLQPYIQQAVLLRSIFVLDICLSAMRPSLGHPTPFNVNHIEIGNEDFAGSTAVAYRCNEFATTLKNTFPSLHIFLIVSELTSNVQALGFMATYYSNNPALSPTKPQDWDVHVYSNPSAYFDF
ncbi:hypothetical protein K435DRAFT_705642, partial [Dendrothele bispora CBS 962.96]